MSHTLLPLKSGKRAQHETTSKDLPSPRKDGESLLPLQLRLAYQDTVTNMKASDTQNFLVSGPQHQQVKSWHCQTALALTQFAFCLGSVYLKRSLRNVNLNQTARFHPIIYAFLREAVAGPIMCSIAYWQTGKQLLFFTFSNPL